MQRLTKKQRQALKDELKRLGYSSSAMRVSKEDGSVTTYYRGVRVFVGYDYNLVKWC